MSREPWDDRRHYPVFVATHYRKSWAHANSAGLADNPAYEPAKHEGDADAALRVVKSSISRLYIAEMKILLNNLEAKGFQRPILVAPYREDSKNMLARTAAVYLGDELGLEVDHSIIETAGSARHKTDKASKIFNDPGFAGEVKKGQAYVAVDDMVNMGGTLASLRSYIDSHGGRYVFACSLASLDGQKAMLDPLPGQAEDVYGRLSTSLQKLLDNVFDIKTATRAELDFVAKPNHAHILRDTILGANGLIPLHP